MFTELKRVDHFILLFICSPVPLQPVRSYPGSKQPTDLWILQQNKAAQRGQRCYLYKWFFFFAYATRPCATTQILPLCLRWETNLRRAERNGRSNSLPFWVMWPFEGPTTVTTAVWKGEQTGCAETGALLISRCAPPQRRACSACVAFYDKCSAKKKRKKEKRMKHLIICSQPSAYSVNLAVSGGSVTVNVSAGLKCWLHHDEAPVHPPPLPCTPPLITYRRSWARFNHLVWSLWFMTA